MSSLLKRFIKVILIDLSGTLHIDDVVIPGSIEALKRLRSANVKIKFVTNTTKESKLTLHRKLLSIGFEINYDEIFTSLTAACQFLKKNEFRSYFLLSNDALEDFKGISIANPNSVVVGLAPEMFDYENMTNAFRLLLNGATLIAIHKARYYKQKDGLALGPGAYIAALEYSTGVTAKVIGKPEKIFFLSALEEFCCSPEEAAMIGDDVRDDIEGSMKAGIKGILVKTGKYREGDERTIEVPPTFVAENFAEAVDKIVSEYLEQ